MRVDRAASITLAVILLATVPARAELTADQVALIAMATSGESQRLADYYAQARGVPLSQIVLLDGKPSEILARSDWEQRVRPALRQWLMSEGRQAKIRCLVTIGDVPLKIGPRDPKSSEMLERRAFLSQTRQARAEQLGEALQSVRTTIGSSASVPPAEAKPAQWAAAFDTLFKEANGWRRDAAEAQRTQLDRQVEQVLLGIRGLQAVVRLAQHTDRVKVPERAVRQLDESRGRLLGLQQGFAALMSLPESSTRDAQALQLLPQIAGLLGTLEWLDGQLSELDRNETYASFDSELSLLLWPDYPLSRWQPNLLSASFDALPNKRPTLMVARLSAPSSELVRRLIDASIAAEKQGLAGTVYLDARGIHGDPKPGSTGQFDQSLRNLAERLRTHTPLTVVLNDEARLFQPGECPDAALYCGWYSLGNYVDAFTWQPGAVGYHIASMEAETLRDPKSKLWCNAMLRDGIAATLGPTYEPYLTAFPLPDEFFSLLLTGRYTLAEVYARTAPLSSWVMVLVGDPLYNPFKNRPLLDEDDLPESLRSKTAPPETPTPVPPEVAPEATPEPPAET